MNNQDRKLALIMDHFRMCRQAKAEMLQRETSDSSFLSADASMQNAPPNTGVAIDARPMKRNTSLDLLHFEALSDWCDQEHEQTASKKRKSYETQQETAAPAKKASRTSFSGLIDAPDDLRRLIEDGSIFQDDVSVGQAGGSWTRDASEAVGPLTGFIAGSRAFETATHLAHPDHSSTDGITDSMCQGAVRDNLQQLLQHRRRPSLDALPLQQSNSNVADVGFHDSSDLQRMILDGSFFDEDQVTTPSTIRRVASETMDNGFRGEVGEFQKQQRTSESPSSIRVTFDASCHDQQHLSVSFEGFYSTEMGGVRESIEDALGNAHSTLVEAMEMSAESQMLIRNWDKRMGLKACHSRTMLLTSKSRDQLMMHSAEVSAPPPAEDVKSLTPRRGLDIPVRQNSQAALMA